MANAISYTSVYNFPYPLGTDDISSGAARLEALARRMEEVLVDAGIEIGTYDVLKTSTVFAGDITGLYNALQISPNTITSVELADNSVDSAAIIAGAVTTAKLDVVDLPAGSTATTQSQLDSSTKLATTSYVDTAAFNFTLGAVPPLSITNTMLAGSIAYSKLSLTGSIVNADVATSAAIAYSKLNLATSIVNADIATGAAIVDTKLATISTAGKVSNTATTATDANTANAIVARDASGNFTAGTITANITGNVSGSSGSTTGNAATVTTNANLTGDVTSVGNATSIASGVIVNADVNASAAISYSKLSLGTSIVNADISTSAAIAYSKLALTGAIVNADLAGSIDPAKITGTAVVTADSRLTDARTPTTHASTHIPGGTDVLDYTKIVGYGTALPTWSGTTHPAGVLWVVNTVGEPYSLYRSDGVSAWKQVGGGGASVTASDTAPSSPTSGALWFDSTTGKTFIWYVDGSSNQWVEVGEASQLSVPTHGSSHVRGGSDVIDGDRVSVDYVPSYYTRDAAASGAGDVTDLTAHLSGIEKRIQALINVVSNTTTTAASITSTTFTDSGITATITPTNTTSKILVTIMASFALVRVSSYPAGANFKLLRNATSLFADTGGQGALRLMASNPLQLQFYGRQTFTYLDSPASTSALTYKLQGNCETTDSTLIFQNNSVISSITLQEIPV